MSKKLKIKIVTKNDFNEDVISKLDKKCFPHDDPCVIGNEDNVWWVAYDGDTPVGFAGIKKYVNTGYVFFNRVGVLKPYRGEGLHKLFIKKRLEYCKKLDWCEKVLTYTANWNISSANNLIKNGFLLYIPQYKYANNDSLYFMKEIER